MNVIAVANQKGGVGKTTSAVMLAHGLARMGYRTLLVDLDSQGNVADALGMDAGGDLYRLLFPGMEIPLLMAVTPSGRENLDVIRADKTTVQLKAALAGDGLSGFRLMQALDGADYDVALIDCAPSVDVLHTAALIAADYLLVPTRLDQLAVKGVRDILQSLVAVNRVSKDGCHLLGVLPTFFDRITRESHEQLEHLVMTFGQAVMPPIPQDTVCREATRHGKTLWEYAPATRALAGVSNGQKRVGGYAQALERIVDAIQ